MHIRDKYVLETEFYRSPDQPKSSWNQLKCKVMEIQENGTSKQVGEFVRNHTALYSTWEPFIQNGKAYALCSPMYTGTSVMSLPDCKIVASEEDGDWNNYGFCPTGFYVPDQIKDYYDDDDPEPLDDKWLGKFGFVCGCVWGDDSSWKIQFLDLSQIQDGKVLRDDRFGYVELPDGAASLSKYIRVCYSDPNEIGITLTVSKDWYGGLKLTAKSRDGGERNINEVTNSAENNMITSLQYHLKSILDMPDSERKALRQTIRDVIYEALMIFTGKRE